MHRDAVSCRGRCIQTGPALSGTDGAPWRAGYFSLNVPSGLALYWFVNNILSTSQQGWLKSNYGQDSASLPGSATIDAADKAEHERLERVKQLTGVVAALSTAFPVGRLL